LLVIEATHHIINKEFEMSKNRRNIQKEADENVAKVMGRGLYWTVTSVLKVPIFFTRGAKKVVKVITDKEEKHGG